MHADNPNAGPFDGLMIALFDMPVSGYDIPGLLRSSLSGPEWLTGGAFGSESSLVALAVCTASAALLTVAWRRGRLRLARLRRRPHSPAPLPPLPGAGRAG